MRTPFTGALSGPLSPHTTTDPSLPPNNPLSGRYGCNISFNVFPQFRPDFTKSFVRSIRTTSLSPITERTFRRQRYLRPVFGRTSANGPSPSMSSIEAFSMPSRSRVVPNPAKFPWSVPAVIGIDHTVRPADACELVLHDLAPAFAR